MKSLQTVGLAVAMHVVLPDAGAAGEARGGRGASVRRLEQLRGDWAEMRVLQWFRGVRPPRSSQKFDTPLRRARGYAIIHAVF